MSLKYEEIESSNGGNGHSPALRPVPTEQEPQTNRDSIDLTECSAIFYRRRALMLATILIVFGIGMLYTLTRRPVYESVAKVVVATGNRGASSSNDDLPLLGDLQALTRGRSVETQAEIILGRDLLDEAFNSLAPAMRAKGFDSREIPKWACQVAAKKNTDVIEITTRAYDGGAAANLANNIVATYFSRNLEHNNMATRQAREYADDKMQIASKDLAGAKAVLSKYKKQIGLIAPEAQIAGIADHIAKLKMDRDESAVELAARRREIAAVKRQISGQQQHVMETSTIMRSPQFNDILVRIDQLNSERAALLEEYTPQSYEVKTVEGRIKSEQQRLERMTESIVSSRTQVRNPIRETLVTGYSTAVAAKAAVEARVQALDTEIAARRKEFSVLPEQERVLSQHMERVALLQRTYELLSRKYYTLLLSEQAMLPNGQLISKARPDREPSYPNRAINGVVLLLLGLALSVGVAVVAERLDCRVHDQASVERATGLATLTAIPYIEGASPLIAQSGAQNNPFLESYRILRSNISFSAIDRRLKLLAVTSPSRSDGKSTTSVNLATVMAMDGKRVLLVDCDLRRPSVHKILNISRAVGVTNVVTGACSLDEAIVPTGVENMSCMPSGPIPPNPVEILNSHHHRDMFRELAERFDVIVVDCPPCTGLSDVQVISTFVDGIILVVSMDRTLRPHLDITARTLKQVEAPMIGLALNRVDCTRKGYGHGHYYYYYDYSEDKAAGDAPIRKSKRSRKAA